MTYRDTPWFKLLILVLAPLAICGCSGCGGSRSEDTPTGNASNTSAIKATPAASSQPVGVKLTDVSEVAGIHYQWDIKGSRPLNILQTIGNGCAFLDYDNDGNLDILLVGPKLALYRGDGKGHFTDATAETSLDKLSGHFLGCAVGDYDNDGYDDLYITAYRGGLLLHNEGGKAFKDVTAQAGLKPQPWSTSAAFADLDGDGKLDLYICNYVQFTDGVTQPQLCDYGKIKGACGPRFYQPEQPVVYHNLGSGKFHDETKAWKAILPNVTGKGLGVAVADFEGQGHLSIAIANDEMPGDLLKNQNGKFANIGTTSGTAYDNDGNVHGGMGVDWGDYDNDGKLDMVVATFQHEVKNIYHNEGSTTFTDNAAALGIGDATKPNVAFGVKWFDYDNDGWLDLMFANGHVQDNIADVDKSATFQQALQVFHSKNGQSFEEVGAQAGPVFQKPIMGRGLAVGDYDNDGRMDVLVVDSIGKPLLLHNETTPVGHWLSVRLAGVKSNRDGLGALVTVEVDGQKRMRRCGTDGSYMSASDRRVHFGLGQATKVDTITVRWIGGKTDTYRDVPVDRVVTLREGASKAE